MCRICEHCHPSVRYNWLVSNKPICVGIYTNSCTIIANQLLKLVVLMMKLHASAKVEERTRLGHEHRRWFRHANAPRLTTATARLAPVQFRVNIPRNTWNRENTST